MKRLYALFIVLLVSCVTLSAGSSIIKHTGEVNGDLRAELPTQLSLSNVASEDMGFTDVAVTSFDQNVKKISAIQFTKKNDNTGILSTKPFYFYWILIDSTTNVPDITLSLEKPLKSTMPAASMHWKASLTYGTENEVISTSVNNTSTSIPLIPGNVEENRLVSTFGSVKIVLSTEKAYWEFPASFYDSRIIVNVSSK